MAWNDVKASTNKAVHLLVTVGGRDFNFRQAVDIKVERKIGDTLSKFSLGIIDDSGSDQRSDYVEFERCIIQEFTSIEIAYGNSWNDMQKFKGFVVDYQPVFFGNTTKLTVTGYITKINSGTPGSTYLTSPYSYWYDWTPYVGVREDTFRDWEDLYAEGGLVFNDAMKQVAVSLGANFTDVSDKWAGNVVDEEAMALINSTLSSESKVFNQTKAQYEGSLTTWFSTGSNASSFFISNGIKGDVTFESLSIGLEENKPSTVTIYYKDLSTGQTGEITQDLSNFISNNYSNDWLEYNGFTMSESAYRKKLNILLNLAKQDAIDAQDAVGEWKGVTPFRQEIMSKYEGNIKFQEFVHKVTNRKIMRVCPDLFVEWDNVVPLTGVDPDLYKKDPGKYMSEFSHHVVCDITVFGLRFKVSAQKVVSGDIENAYTLYPQDRWGVYRVYKSSTNGKYYIWVGDAPKLWQKYKQYKDFNLQKQETTYKFGKEEVDTNHRNWAANATYSEGDIIYFNHDVGSIVTEDTKIAEALTNFSTGDNPKMGAWEKFWDWWIEGTGFQETKYQGLLEMWKNAVINKQIVVKNKVDTLTEYDKQLHDVRDYEIYALREKDMEYTWINDKNTAERGAVVTGRDYQGRSVTMSREYRIRTYLQAAFRSALPLAYGQVRISDIVKQLAYLEGWDDNEITSTTPSNYSDSFFFMNGQTALEYISETLGPEAVEAGGGRVGFTTYFNKNKFIFKPASMYYNGGTVYETGYNRKDSDVISFTVRSRGVLLMQGVDADIANINAYTNESVAASTTRRGTDMSKAEARLRQELVHSEYGTGIDPYSTFFNLPLYYYYGNSSNDVGEFATFVKNVSNYMSIAEIPFSSQTMVKTNSSSISSSTDVVKTALNDIEKIRNTCIQAEMTIMGNTKLSPGQWITINNYSKRGPHYTSGDYFVQNITDQVTAGGAFTQSLNMYRFSGKVSAMTTGSTHLETGISILQKYGQARFESWILNNYPELAAEYNISIDNLGQNTPGSSSLLTGNEGKPYYKKINGVEFWGKSKLVEYDKEYTEGHNPDGWWSTYFYPDSGTYHIISTGTAHSGETVEVGYISSYKAYTLKDGSYFDKYGNIVMPLN